MQNGRYRHRITIQTITPTETDSGATLQVPTTFATRWASANPLRGKEAFTLAQETAEQGTLFRCHYKSGVTPQMKILFKSRTLNIYSVLNIAERNKTLEILATEKVKQTGG